MRETDQTRRSRQNILDAAAGLLIERGTPGLTVEAVVQRSGAARATVYRHFPTVGDLLLAAVEQLLPIPDVPAPGPLADRLLAGLRRLADDFERLRPLRVVAALAQDGSDVLTPALRARMAQAHRRPLLEPLREAVASGDLPPDADVDLVFALLIGPLLATSLLTAVRLDEGRLRAVVTTVLGAPPRLTPNRQDEIV